MSRPSSPGRKLAKKSNASVQSPTASYSAPALDKGLDILELLCRSNTSMSLTEMADNLGRSVSEIYRMLACLVSRNYIVSLGESYVISTKLFALAHSNPPTNRLLTEAGPIMQELSSRLDQACHLTVYSEGAQIVVSKVDNPSGMGFSVRVGAELDVLVSASGRVLLAFQDPAIIEQRIKESVRRRPEQANAQIQQVLKKIRGRGYESIVSVQVKGLHAVSYPILDTQASAIAALTVPYAERLDLSKRKTIADAEVALKKAAGELSERIGGPGKTP